MSAPAHTPHPFTADMVADELEAQTAAIQAAADAAAAVVDLKAQRAALAADHDTPAAERGEKAATLDNAIRFAAGDHTAAEGRVRAAVGRLRNADRAALASEEGARRRRVALVEDRAALVARVTEHADALRSALVELDALDGNIGRALDAEAQKRGAYVSQSGMEPPSAADQAAQFVRTIPADVTAWPSSAVTAIARAIAGAEPWTEFHHWTWTPADLDAVNSARVSGMTNGHTFRKWSTTTPPIPSSSRNPRQPKTPRPSSTTGRGTGPA